MRKEINQNEVTRRHFLSALAMAGGLQVKPAASASRRASTATAKPALLGGSPVRTQPFPSWPVFDGREEEAILSVLRSGKWFRGTGETVDRFEQDYARLTGAKHCLATANGTSALFISLSALGVGAGDEVILPPYTFVACVNVVLLLHALPVFVDSQPETFQIDARKIEAAIGEHTKAIMPVHLGGGAADLDAILSIAGKHKLPVVEDACQAHLAEWRGRKVGTLGQTGCFSFQASKNLNSGEGGAILTESEELAEKCFAFHSQGRPRRTGSYTFSYTNRGTNLRMTEFQAALLLAQMARLEEQMNVRERNAQYLSKLLAEIPGILPAQTHEGCTRHAYHLFMFRYQRESFAGLPRDRFLKALRAEGIPVSGGYAPLNREPFLRQTLQSRAYQRIYSSERIALWEERNHCPENDRLCEDAVWLTQNMLLGARSDMEQIAEAVLKIRSHAGKLRESLQ